MCVHLDEGEATVSLEAGLDDIPKVLEQGDEVVLGGVGGEVADVAGSLPLGSLLNDHVVALDTVSREVVMPEGGSRSHAHGSHGLLLGDGRLALLVGPVAADGTGTKPLSVHGAEGLFSIGSVAEGNKSVATRSTRLHIPHNTSFGDGTAGREGLEEDFVIDFVAEVTNKNVKMVGGVLLGGSVRLVSPVDTNFLKFY